MKKSERVIVSLVLMALGVLFIILKDSFIGILMTVAGVGLIALGILDIIRRDYPQAIIKILSGVLLVISGWAIVEAVLYVLSGLLLVFGSLFLYDKMKNSRRCDSVWQGILDYSLPIIAIAIGTLLLFHRESVINVVFIVSGALTVVAGGLLLLGTFIEE